MEDRDHAPIPRRSGTTAWRHLRGDAALARLSQRIHHHHPWHLRQTELPMPSAQPARTWPQRTLDPQGGRKDHHGDLCYAGRTAQGATRGGGLSPLSGAVGAIIGSQRADLQRSPRGTGTHTAEKKTADAIRQEVAREIDQLLHMVFSGRQELWPRTLRPKPTTWAGSKGRECDHRSPLRSDQRKIRGLL